MVCFSNVRTASAVMFLVMIGGMAGLFSCASRADAASCEEVWVQPSVYQQGDKVSVELSAAPVTAAANPVKFSYLLRSEMAFESVNILFRVVDAGGKTVYESQVGCNVTAGDNRCDFEWPALSCVPGRYQAVLEIYYTSKRAPIRCVTPVDRVSSALMGEEVTALGGQLDDILSRVDGMGQGAGSLPYARARISLARELLGVVQNNFVDSKWTDAARNLQYVRRTVESLGATLVFSGAAPELSGSLSKFSGRVMPQGGSLVSEGQPVALLGAVLDLTKPDPASRLARMAALGMNFAVLPVDEVAEVVAAPFDAAVMRGILAPVLDAAESQGVAVVLQLSQDALGHAIQQQVPDVQAPGFVTLSNPGLCAALERHVQAMGEAVAGREAVMGVSLAEAPAFKFDGEPVRKAFVNRVHEQYPDRQDLNQIWRSHLADYDEITIWGDHPAHAYQNQRAYQFDWQSFHSLLIDETLSSLRSSAGPACPGLSIMISMPDTAFEKGESKYAPDRELAARLMDINGCTVSAGAAAKPPYAVEFPRATIHYVLQRSYFPQKPVLNLCAGLDVSAEPDPWKCYGMIRTLLWEALVSGASGLAVAPDSPIYSRPEAMEALVVTALDARRLSKVVSAFAEAPADIMILFSESSKVLDNGEPHLLSALYAYEGAAFSGYNVRFVTERDLANGVLDKSKVLIMPETPAVTDAAFTKISEFVENGGATARVGTPIPYNERGKSRADVIRNTGNTVFVQGMNMPTEYLHAMDTSVVRDVLSAIPRPVNNYGYPLEGVHSRFVMVDGTAYLYIVNLRPQTVPCELTGGMQSGRDLLQGREVTFPRELTPLEPMLIRMDVSLNKITAQ